MRSGKIHDFHRARRVSRAANPGVLLSWALVMLLSGCVRIDIETAFTPDQRLHSRIVNQQEDSFPDLDPLRIDDELRAYLDASLVRGATTQERVQNLQKVLFGEEGLDLQYSDDRTQTALEVFESGSGNCLSVMNLYVAAARYLGLDASFQTVQVRPSWDRRGTLLVLSQHINATGRMTVRNYYIVDFTPEIQLQQMTSSVISDSDARALYFNNLGVEQMVEGEFEGALIYLKNALWIQPELSIAWNNIGTVYNRLGEPELAEYGYEMAFYTDRTNATAINNLARFYEATGEADKARVYRQAITSFNRRNPYYHFDQGNHAIREGRIEEAIEHFRRAIRIKDVEPVFYNALAQAYDLIGNTRLQRQMLTAAEELLARNDEIYQPSDQNVRFIDRQSIMRDTSAGMSILVN